MTPPVVGHSRRCPPRASPRPAPEPLLDDSVGRAGPLLPGARPHRSQGARRHHPHRPLRRFAHHRRPDHRRCPRHPASPLRRCRPRLHPARQALGLVPAHRRAGGGQGLADATRPAASKRATGCSDWAACLSSGPAATSRIRFDATRYTHFELWFLRQPGGGTVTLTRRRQRARQRRHCGRTKQPGFAAFETNEPAHTAGTARHAGPRAHLRRHRRARRAGCGLRQSRPQRRLRDRALAHVQPAALDRRTPAPPPGPGDRQLRHQRSRFRRVRGKAGTRRNCARPSAGCAPRFPKLPSW